MAITFKYAFHTNSNGEASSIGRGLAVPYHGPGRRWWDDRCDLVDRPQPGCALPRPEQIGHPLARGRLATSKRSPSEFSPHFYYSDVKRLAICHTIEDSFQLCLVLTPVRTSLHPIPNRESRGLHLSCLSPFFCQWPEVLLFRFPRTHFLKQTRNFSPTDSPEEPQAIPYPIDQPESFL